MSPQNLVAQELASGQIEVKQRTSVYTMMLILSFIAICTACTLLWLELDRYGKLPMWKTEGVAPATSSLHAPMNSEWPYMTPTTWQRA
ncbi:MAG: hypothetical protein H8E44_39235 [Planctomycetes bacterium]|nr:hypothetical protein [Planctomycetota bacterium]MBL7042861.1 hypothetical protein [Pirellulaceae bacterium]